MSQDGPGFFQRVYALVALIPTGKVATYGQIAALLEHPRAARTVGWALQALPEGLEIPWHRVINARGHISASGREHSAAEQRLRLEAEGVRFRRDGSIPFGQHLWEGPQW